MIRNKLFAGFALMVLIFGGLSAFISVGVIKEQVVKEAQTSVKLNLNSAWGILDSELNRIETVLELVSDKQLIVDSCFEQDWSEREIQNRLELIRINSGFDFLTLVSPKSEVVIRSAAPYKTGDYRIASNPVQKALKGESVTSYELLSVKELENEGEGLSEKAYTVLEDTPRSRPTAKIAETRGLVMLGAVPVRSGNQVLGALYGGVLVNRNEEIVDRIKDMLFKNEQYNERSTGTVTIFLNDTRIATTVRLNNGNRAIGTRVSKEVADTVLDNVRIWQERAFVVNDWYLTAYEPVLNSQQQVIGMLYVGLLEKPFIDLIRSTILRYVYLSLIGFVLSLLFAFFLAGRIAKPLHSLAQAARKMRKGEMPEPVFCKRSTRETALLMEAFNEMVSSLSERENSLKNANEKLGVLNESLTVVNRSYMETVGFISHELKSPLATIMNYVYLIQEKKFGPLTEKQERGIKNIDDNVRLLVEMVRHYLNLSRIENNELEPVVSRVLLNEEVLDQLIDSFQASTDERNIKIINNIPADTILKTDLNMTREVFENLISNAVKYGRDGGTIKLGAIVEKDFIRFSVFNEGEGVAPEQIDNLFKKFSRLENEKEARKRRGTGLGLFITKKIIEAHGGKITVKSTHNEWIDFVFTLPVYKIAEKKEKTVKGEEE